MKIFNLVLLGALLSCSVQNGNESQVAQNTSPGKTNPLCQSFTTDLINSTYKRTYDGRNNYSASAVALCSDIFKDTSIGKINNRGDKSVCLNKLEPKLKVNDSNAHMAVLKCIHGESGDYAQINFCDTGCGDDFYPGTNKDACYIKETGVTCSFDRNVTAPTPTPKSPRVPAI